MLRVATVTAAALLALLVSCFSKPDAPHVGDGSAVDDGRRDGMGSMIDAGPCTTPHDDFEQASPGLPCGQWGTAMNSGYLNRANGTLRVTPSMPAANASCLSIPFRFDQGTSLQIVDALIDAMGDHTFFKVSPASGSGQFVQINMFNSGSAMSVQALCGGSTSSQAYDSTLHRWWKLEPMFPTTSVQIFSGSDGVAWVPFAPLPQCNWGVATGGMVTAEFGGGAGVATTGLGIFDNFNIKTCPPSP